MISDVRQTLTVDAAGASTEWQAAAGLIFSCATRKHILGTQTTEEIKMLRAHLPPGIALMGFYSFGEISPMEANGPSLLHNCTFITLLLGEHHSTDARAGGRPAITIAPPRHSRHALER